MARTSRKEHIKPKGSKQRMKLVGWWEKVSILRNENLTKWENMTVIAWDGKVLAADKRADVGGTGITTTKIKKLSSGKVVAFTGSVGAGRILMDWYENGADRDEWPDSQHEDDWARLIVASSEGVVFYESHPVAIHVQDEFTAFGSGRDVAIGALAMGATAIQAVEIASRFQSDCGHGCDSFNV